MLLRSTRMLLIVVGLISITSGEALAQFTISGTVRDPGNNPVASVDVFLYTSNGDPIGGINPAVTNSSGFYALGDGQIPSGTYNVGFEPPSNTELLSKMVTGVVVTNNVTLDVNLEAGLHLSGFVRDTAGAGIPDIDMNAYYESDGQAINLMNDNTLSDGSYDLLLPHGLLRIVYRPVQGENLVPVELRNVNMSQDTTIDVVLQAGYVVSGTVTGPGGTPVVGADIDAEDSFTGIRLYTPGDNTDNNGNYQIKVPAGTFNFNVEAVANDHLVPKIVYNVAVTGNTVVNFALEAGYILSGTVRDPLSNPVSDADIDVRNFTTGERLYTPSDNTNLAGFYQVAIPAGTYNVDFKPAVVPPYLAPARIPNVGVTSDLVLDVVVPNGNLLSGQVRNFRGVGVAGVNTDANDSLNIDMLLVGDFTAPDGNFGVVLPPGLYDIEFEPSQFSALAPELLNNFRLHVDTSIIVVLDSGLVITGSVRDSVGNPFDHVHVIARRSSDGVERFTPGNSTDIVGFYRIAVPSDIYDLTYKPDPITGVPDTVTLTDVWVTADLVIDINFPFHNGDTEPPSVTVLSPNGGESIQAYELFPITWSAADNVGVTSIDIYYSITGLPGPFTPIILGEPNDGVYSWAVPPEPTSDARIRIVARDASFNSAEDLSDSSFSIIHSAQCCGGLKGDVNGNGQTNGVDVVYFVSYLKGGPPPTDSCDCGSRGRIMALADANGNCQVNGLDVSYMVAFFKGGQGLLCCPDCPPIINRMTGDDNSR